MISWFSSCALVLLIDQVFLCKSVHILRRAYLLSLSGDNEKSLELLDSIAPSSDSYISLPESIYHLHKAELLSRCSDYLSALREFELAESAGADKEHLAISKSRLAREKDGKEHAQRILDELKEQIGETPGVLIEEGRQLLDTREDLWQAKEIFQRVLKMPNKPHFAGESSHQIALAYLAVCMLGTGQAEQGIQKLSDSISRFQSQTAFVDTLRPLLAELLSYRALYYATHKSPTEGVVDLKVALSLCSYPKLIERIEKAKQELVWRHGIELS
jgi:hypothetical protein